MKKLTLKYLSLAYFHLNLLANLLDLVTGEKGQSTRSAGLGAEFAMPGIPTSRNYLQLRERKGKDNKRQRRSPPSLPSRAMSARGKSGTQWSKYYCGSKSN